MFILAYMDRIILKLNILQTSATLLIPNEQIPMNSYFFVI